MLAATCSPVSGSFESLMMPQGESVSGRRDGGDEVVAEVAEASHRADRRRTPWGRLSVTGLWQSMTIGFAFAMRDDGRAVVALLAELIGERVAAGRPPCPATSPRLHALISFTR